MRYPVDELTAEERARIAPHVSNLEAPVFALVNLPETVKGALFARYSRYPGTLRRLFLDEFADSLPATARGVRRRGGQARGRALRAHLRRLRRRQRGPARRRPRRRASGAPTSSPSCCSGPRLGAYLEQSTRYLAYDHAMAPGAGYRYYRDDRARAGVRGGDGLPVHHLLRRAPARARMGRRDLPARRRRVGRRPQPRRQREGVRPAARPAARRLAVAHGHLRDRPGLRAADPAPARPSAARGPPLRRADPRRDQGHDAELRRAGRAARARRRVGHLPPAARAPPASKLGRAPRVSTAPRTRPTPARRSSCSTSTATRTSCSPRCSSRRPVLRRRRRWPRSRSCPTRTAARALADLVGDRRNRRHRPGRGYEALRYRFEVVSDYGAFRDLQRHRMLTVQWQALSPDLGAGVPEEVVAAGVGDAYRRALDRSQAEYRPPCRRRPARCGALRALPRLPHPLRPRPQRPRGHAPRRAALRPRRPPGLPRRRPRDAPRRSPPSIRRWVAPCATSTPRPSPASSASSPRCARRLAPPCAECEDGGPSPREEPP